jgi:hypothetical protein
METSELGTASASGLHMVMHMKRVAVAMLAMVVVSGCGVGADETYDGQNVVAAHGQALDGPDVGPALPGAGIPQVTGTAAPSPVHDPSTVALPQDPIPVFEGRPAPDPAPILGGFIPAPLSGADQAIR